MELAKLLPVFLISFLISENVKSQDTSIVNYFPMNVGNVWVYHCATSGINCPCSKEIRIRITGSLIISGKRHYLFEKLITNPGAPCTCGAIFFSLDTNRVDSVSGNVLKFSQNGCNYSPNQIMQDSLRARINDSIRAACIQNPYFECQDTNVFTIFGYIRQARRYGYLNFELGWTRTYVKGFGIASISSSGGTSCYIWQTNLRGCVINGVVYGDTTFLVGIKQISTEVPDKFSSYQNYPNPFNPNTIIRFQIADFRFTELKIYDVVGREVATLVNEELKPGTYEVEWNAANYPSGVYYYKLSAGDYEETKKMVLLK